MNPVRLKIIARMLIMLLLMTPLTGMAMQLSAQSLEMSHCDDMQMKQNGHEQVDRKHCNRNAGGQELCNTAQHCSNTPISLLNSCDPAINTAACGIYVSSSQSVQFSIIPNELFRPPRA